MSLVISLLKPAEACQPLTRVFAYLALISPVP